MYVTLHRSLKGLLVLWGRSPPPSLREIAHRKNALVIKINENFPKPRYFISPLLTNFPLVTSQNKFYPGQIVWFIKLSVQTFQPLNVIYRRGNFVYFLWGVPQFILLAIYHLALDVWYTFNLIFLFGGELIDVITYNSLLL